VKDLSLWSIDLSRVEPRRDPQGRTSYVYVVGVKRRDALGSGVGIVLQKPKFSAGENPEEVFEAKPYLVLDSSNNEQGRLA